MRKNSVNRHVECFGDLKRQLQRGGVFVLLDGDHRLTGNADPVGQIGLCPVPLGPQDLDSVDNQSNQNLS